MAKARVVLNLPKFRDLRRSQEAQDAVKAEADRIQSSAGPNFDAIVSVGPNRARAVVIPNSFEGILDEAKHGALSKAVGGG